MLETTLSRATTSPKRRARRAARKAARDVAEAAANPWFERAARFGYVVRGCLYGVMGLLALEIALGAGGRGADQRQALSMLPAGPIRWTVLAAVFVGAAAYALWGFVRAVYDPLRRGDDPAGIAERLGFVWSGLAYSGLLVFVLQFLAGRTAAEADSTQATVDAVLSRPAGRWLVLVAGLVAVAAGLGQFVDAYRAGFRKDLKRGKMNKAQRVSADTLGRLGMFARGVIFTMVGWFVFQAAWTGDPNQAHGMGAAFVKLSTEPLGHFLLGVVALGFVALGLHSFASAIWIRMMSSK